MIEKISKCKAIVMFGPDHPERGKHPGQFYQVTIDPDFMSPGGDFIRFGMTPGDEIVGWQMVSGLTICEVLGYYDGDVYPTAPGESCDLHMMVVRDGLQPLSVS